MRPELNNQAALRPYFSPRFSRPRKRRRVTLIAGLRCNTNGDRGVVICADSQETYGDYKVTVSKIRPRDAGNYVAVIGGSGNTAALIDGQANLIETLIKKWPSGLTEEQGRQSLEEILVGYHKTRVKYYP